MKRLLAAVLVVLVLLSIGVCPVFGAEGDVVIDSQDSPFPEDTTIAGDLILTEDCPDTVVLINVTVQGMLRIDAEKTVTVRLQGDSACAGVEVHSSATLIGGSLGNIVSDAPICRMEDTSADSLTIDRTGGYVLMEDTTIGELTMNQSNILAGGKGCQVSTVIKNAPNCLFSGTFSEMQKNYDESEEVDTASHPENYDVKADLELHTPTVSPAHSIARATLTFTDVPDDMEGDYRLYWFINGIRVSNDWHFTLEEGAVSQLESSVHFDGVMESVPVWAELTSNYDEDVVLRYVCQVKTDYSTAPWDSLEYTAYPYEIQLFRNQNTVVVYGMDEKGEYSQIVNVFVCSVGLYNPTREGEFAINLKYRWGSLLGDLYGQYSSQFVGNLLFHSVPYRSQERFDIEFEEYNKLGEPASSGCVRLCTADAMWIYDHCRQGTKVLVFDSDTLPVDKPIPIPISEDGRYRGWDPTDPYPGNPTRASLVPVLPKAPTMMELHIKDRIEK